MVRTGHLGRFELFALVVIASVADIFLNYPQQLVLYGGSAGWMIPLVSMGFCLLVWSAVGPVLARRKGQVVVPGRRRGAALAAVLFGLVLPVVIVLNTASEMRLFIETAITTVLPRSPISFVAVPFLLTVVYYAYKGVEGLSRVSWLLTPWLLLGLAALLVLNANWMNPAYLLPIWGSGLPHLLYGGWIFTGLFVNILLLAILASRLRDPADSVKIGFWSTVAVGLIYSAVTLAFTLVFPPEAGAQVPFPLYQLGRLIYIGRFMQRLEAAFVLIWMAMALIKIAAGVWISTYLIALAFRMPVNRPLVFPVALIVYALAFFPRNLPETMALNTHYVLRWGWVVAIALPLVMLLWVGVRSRKEETADEQASPTS
ncbi:GerAB/ArcD/ProY family transporter [Effusibacillus pohliae]|uniref:GerAB/ArcD/ProY family transporter n=1 Tax=Effusibacillus pohliae TaxID=232270 RepID=UPI00036A7C51|nr:GerAB/ArcD/ProY family transporter [Effusibacillus pohliae]